MEMQDCIIIIHHTFILHILISYYSYKLPNYLPNIQLLIPKDTLTCDSALSEYKYETSSKDDWMYKQIKQMFTKQMCNL